ncbi:hypothetical protein B0H17DRAFT_335377 [Mycena rosella]|uniref:RBR-type E3 ubiquitin transferase n=1 Tax=Mycena rosella TaxID=1033263 RepID=A0AAD7CS29_MYCRO|nr:hypothetical protein B0H17DRAFT_335377 [Mycena rosella]
MSSSILWRMITIKQGEVAVEIDDTVAKLVLGEANMDEWNDARFLATHNIIYCPFTGCGKAFDTDISSSRDQARVQCPDCSRSICQVCKTVWHENMTCQVYQAIPISERVPDDAALLDLAKQLNWRQCPKCYAWPMELKHGCNHTICIICRHHFCYTCGADFDYTGGKYRCRGGEACRVWEDL